MACSIIPLPNGKSKVWRHFGFRTDGTGTILNKREVVCKICAQTLPYSGNTTNLTHHLKHSHDEEYLLLGKSSPSPSRQKPKKKEQMQMDCFTKGLYSRGSQRFKQCEESVMEYMCKDMEPLSTVDSVLFLRLLQTMDPRFSCPLFASAITCQVRSR